MAFVARSITAALLVMAAAVGCTAADEVGSGQGEGAGDDDAGDQSTVKIGGEPSTNQPTTTEPDSGTTAPGTVNNDPGSMASTTEWTGTVAFTSFVPYGPDACRLSTRFENVVVNVSLSDDKVAAATISGKDFEKLVGGCSTKPAPTARASTSHTWTYSSQTATASTVTMPPAAGDPLPTEVTMQVGLDSATKAWASISIKRTDAAPPNEWTVGPQYVALTKK